MLKCHHFIALNISVNQRGQDIIIKYVQAEENKMEVKFLLSSITCFPREKEANLELAAHPVYSALLLGSSTLFGSSRLCLSLK